MKRIVFLIAVIGISFLQSCVGPEGPMGPKGNPGEDGLISSVFEVTTNFNSINDFSHLVTFSNPIYSSDMVLVYQLYEVNNGTDIWRLLPQTYYFENGDEIDYNFDFTKYDVNIFMGANFDLNLASSVWTQNQTFRIVIIPGYFGNKLSKPIDFKDYDATLKAFNIDPLKIEKIKG